MASDRPLLGTLHLAMRTGRWRTSTVFVSRKRSRAPSSRLRGEGEARMCACVLAAHGVRVLPERRPRICERAQGRPGAGWHPWSACSKKHAAEPQVQPEQPAFPAQWFYGLYVVSSGTGLSCPRHRRDAKHHRQLDASVGAPGPHDFAVRDTNIRLLRYRVHRIPLPTFVTIAKRPSYRVRDALMIVLIWG